MRKQWNIKERLTAVVLSTFLALNSFSGSELMILAAEKDSISEALTLISSNEVVEDEVISENEAGKEEEASAVLS